MKEIQEDETRYTRDDSHEHRAVTESHRDAIADRWREVHDQVEDDGRWGRRPEDLLARRERLHASDSLRHVDDGSVERLEELEDVELETSPGGFARRHAGEGLDRATLRRWHDALQERQRR